MSKKWTAAVALALLVGATWAARAETPRAADIEVHKETLRTALGSQVRLVWLPNAARPSSVTGFVQSVPGATATERATSFLALRAEALRLDGIALRPLQTSPGLRRLVVQLQQEHEGVPVYQRGATVTFDARGEQVRGVRLEVADIVLPDATDDVGRDAALTAALAKLRGTQLRDAAPQVTQVILPGPPARLAYQVRVPTLVPLGTVSVFVDAATGDILMQRPDGIHE